MTPGADFERLVPGGFCFVGSIIFMNISAKCIMYELVGINNRLVGVFYLFMFQGVE